MKYVALAVLAFVAIVHSDEKSDEASDHLKHLHECAKKISGNPDLKINEAVSMLKEKKAECLGHCTLLKDKVMNEEGSFNKQATIAVMKRFAPNANDGALSDLYDACVAKVTEEKDVCKKADQLIHGCMEEFEKLKSNNN